MISEDPANGMAPGTSLWSRELAAKASRKKSTLERLHKPKKILLTIFFELWIGLLWRFFHDTFAASFSEPNLWKKVLDSDGPATYLRGLPVS